VLASFVEGLEPAGNEKGKADREVNQWLKTAFLFIRSKYSNQITSHLYHSNFNQFDQENLKTCAHKFLGANDVRLCYSAELIFGAYYRAL
jgi:hypothetical protein